MRRIDVRVGAAALLLGALQAWGCAAASSNGNPVDAGHGSGGSSGGGGGSSGALCHVAISPVGSVSFDGLTSGPGVTLRVRGDIRDPSSAGYTWRWSVTAADGSDVAYVSIGNSAGVPGLIDLALAQPGSYTIAVDATGAAKCSGEVTALVQAPNALAATYRFRFVPPPDTLPIQERQIQVFGRTPWGGNRLVLDRGTSVRVDPRGETVTGPLLPAYLRINDRDGRVIGERHTTAGGPLAALTLVAGSYDLLVVPDGDVAPLLVAGRDPSQLAAAMPLALPRGIAISGTVVDDAGAPLPGARVVLRAGVLPSTMGTSLADGAFTLRAGPGSYGATIVQQSGDGVLELTIPESARALTIDGVTPPPPMTVRISRAGSSALTLPLTATDPNSFGAGVRVVVESAAPLLNVATVTFGGSPQMASVRFRAELTPHADGANPGAATVTIAGMPAAHYRATVFPAAAAAGVDAVTVADIDLSLSAGGSFSQAIALKPKVALTGKLIPEGLAAGVRVTALDVGGDFPIAVGGDAQADGAFSLPVSPERTYSVRAQPGSGQLLARAIFASVKVSAIGAALGSNTMPAALLYSGTVVDDALQPLNGALVIQVFCLPVAADDPRCPDPEAPLAETATRSDGFFRLLLPDPGVAP
jgi:hypothetical protein